jgi:hypothetical protein
MYTKYFDFTISLNSLKCIAKNKKKSHFFFCCVRRDPSFESNETAKKLLTQAEIPNHIMRIFLNFAYNIVCFSVLVTISINYLTRERDFIQENRIFDSSLHYKLVLTKLYS